MRIALVSLFILCRSALYSQELGHTYTRIEVSKVTYYHFCKYIPIIEHGDIRDIVFYFDATNVLYTKSGNNEAVAWLCHAVSKVIDNGKEIMIYPVYNGRTYYVITDPETGKLSLLSFGKFDSAYYTITSLEVDYVH